MKTIAEQARETMEKLFQDAGYTAAELLDYVQNLESENARLTLMVRKLKREAARKTSSSETMNSRLKDALRE